MFARTLAKVAAAIPTSVKYRLVALRPAVTAAMRLGQSTVIIATDAGPVRWRTDALTSQRFLLGTYELYMQEAFVAHVRPGMTVYDVGAHAGFHSLFCGRLVSPTGEVIGFEPNPLSRRSAERQAALNPDLRVSFLPYAVSDRCGPAFLDTSLDSSQSHLKEAGDTPVEVRTIDCLVAAGVVGPPDVVKIDVEGHESQVIHGGLETLRQKRPVILCDYNDVNTLTLMAQLLEPIGYSILPGPPVIGLP